jgi:gliding motility-associated lipoprotein GldH
MAKLLKASRILLFIQFIACSIFLSACTDIDLYEKVAAIPDHQWKGSFKPSFTFEIQDTTVPYQVYVILRHNEKYNYNNIWVNLHTKSPDSTISKAQYELPLANTEKGWLGTGMDDLYEHRIALTPINQRFYFKKAGTYTFTLEHVMREEPLENVMNIGLRIEKKPQ